MGRSASHQRLLLRRFSQELRARQIPLDLKAELLRFSRNLGLRLSLRGGGDGEAAVEDALAARAARRERAMAARARARGRDRPGEARGAIRGLRFISRSRADAWGDVEGSFEKLARNGFLSRSDFAQCIGNDGIEVVRVGIVRHADTAEGNEEGGRAEPSCAEQ